MIGLLNLIEGWGVNKQQEGKENSSEINRRGARLLEKKEYSQASQGTCSAPLVP